MQGVSLPASQTLPTYVLLALVYGGTLIARRQRPQNGLLSYAAVSLLDVEGNFLVVRRHVLQGSSNTLNCGVLHASGAPLTQAMEA